MLYVCVCSHTHYVQIIYHHCTYVYIYIYLFIYTIMSQSLDLSLVCHQCFNVFTIRSNGKVGASRQAHNAHNGHNSVVLTEIQLLPLLRDTSVARCQTKISFFGC